MCVLFGVTLGGVGVSLAVIRNKNNEIRRMKKKDRFIKEGKEMDED